MAPSEEFAKGTPHVDQSIPMDWAAFERGADTFVAYDVPERPGVDLFVVSTLTPDVRSLAKADAVLYEGNLVRPHWDEDLRIVKFFHDYAGRMGKHPVDEILDDPAVRLEHLPKVDLAEVTA